MVIRITIATSGKIVEVETCALLLFFFRDFLRLCRVSLVVTSISDVEVGDIFEDVEVFVHFEFFSWIYFLLLRNVLLFLLTFNLLKDIAVEIEILHLLVFL